MTMTLEFSIIGPREAGSTPHVALSSGEIVAFLCFLWRSKYAVGYYCSITITSPKKRFHDVCNFKCTDLCKSDS